MDHTCTLCFAPETCARVALTALEEVGAKFEAKVIAYLAGEHRGPEFLAINPAGKVPTLVTPDGPLVQNVAILSYLKAQFPASSLLRQREGNLGTSINPVI